MELSSEPKKELLELLSVKDRSKESLLDSLPNIMRWNKNELKPLLDSFYVNDADSSSPNKIKLSVYSQLLSKIKDCFSVSKRLAIPADVILAGIKVLTGSTYPESAELYEEFSKKITPSLDKVSKENGNRATAILLENIRDILLPIVLKKIQQDYSDIDSADHLSDYFLCDVSMSGRLKIDPVSHAIDSVQTYLMRCQGNKEHVKPSSIDAKDWKWIADFRIWQAEQKAKAYPDNYRQPGDHDNETEQFKELRKRLSKEKIAIKTAEEAYKTYLTELDELKNLEVRQPDWFDIEDSSTEESLHTLWAFGRSTTKQQTYYYNRTVEEYTGNLLHWSSWKKIPHKIPADVVNNVYFNKKMYVFWVEESQITDIDPTITDNGSNFPVKFTIYTNTIKFTSMDSRGVWSNPSTLINFPGTLITTSEEETKLTSFVNLKKNNDNTTWKAIHLSIDEKRKSLLFIRFLLPNKVNYKDLQSKYKNSHLTKYYNFYKLANGKDYITFCMNQNESSFRPQEDDSFEKPDWVELIFDENFVEEYPQAYSSYLSEVNFHIHLLIAKKLQSILDFPSAKSQLDLISKNQKADEEKLSTIIEKAKLLIEWGDNEFRMENWQSLSQATQLYFQAEDLLGKRPITKQLKDRYNQEENRSYHKLSSDSEKLHFTQPTNPQLIALWEKIADRLFKLRYGLNISGQAQLPDNYGAVLNPKRIIALEKRRDVNPYNLATLTGSLSAYRFRELYEVTQSSINMVTQFGSQLYEALQQQDNHRLEAMHATHALDIANYLENNFERQLIAAQKELHTIESELRGVRKEAAYYAKLIYSDQGYSPHHKRAIAGLVRDVEDVMQRQKDQGFKTNYLQDSNSTTSSLTSVGNLPIPGGIGSFVSNAASSVVNGVEDVAGGAVKKVSGGIGDVVHEIGGFVTKAVKEIGEVAGKVEKSTSHIASNLAKTADEILDLSEDSVEIFRKEPVEAENAALQYTQESETNQAFSLATRTGAAVAHLIPNIFGFSDGGMHFGAAVDSAAAIPEGLASALQTNSQSASMQAERLWRKKEWEHQKDLAFNNIERIKQSKAAAQIRLNIAQANLKQHQMEMQQAQEVYDYLKNKFTNAELSQWMTGQLSSLYFSAYQLALSSLHNLQCAYQYELDETDNFIPQNAWSDLHKGLLAGEALKLAAARMHDAYIQNNKRRLEIEKVFSLKAHASTSKPDKVCENDKWDDLKSKKPWCFCISLNDLGTRYKGKTLKIKSVSVSIPAVLGPYETFDANLKQVKASATDSDPKNWQATGEEIIISKGLDDMGIFQMG